MTAQQGGCRELPPAAIVYNTGELLAQVSTTPISDTALVKAHKQTSVILVACLAAITLLFALLSAYNLFFRKKAPKCEICEFKVFKDF
jgi:hypothetical protein